MKSSKLIKINSKDFIQLELIAINQKDRAFYFSKVNAEHLLAVYTVKPAEYDIELLSALAKEYPDEQSYYQSLVEERQKEDYPDEWQRPENEDRVRDIKKYINDNEFCFFPNTIIVTCELANTLDESWSFKEVEEHLTKNFDIFCYYVKEENVDYLYIPCIKGSLLIVDGQHRIRGLEDSNYYEKFELMLSFIIGYDRSVVANQFYTINYNQKPVNKSLLYQLTSQFSKELSEVTFFHNVLKALNEVDSSPFYQRIKMLGIAPKKGSVSEEIRKKMTVSQAFLIDYLTPTVGKRAVKGYAQPIFRYYYDKSEQRSLIVQFLQRYFNALRLEFPDHWIDPEYSILSKTLGVAAMIKILPLLYIKLLLDEWDEDPDKIEEMKTKDFRRYFKNIDSTLFLRKGEFGGGTSAGSVTKLRDSLLTQMGLFSTDEINKYLARYSRWFSENAMVGGL